MALQELVNACVVLVRAIPLVELVRVDIEASLPCAYSLYNADLDRDGVIAEDYSLSYFSLRQLVIILEVVRIILLLLLLLSTEIWEA